VLPEIEREDDRKPSELAELMVSNEGGVKRTRARVSIHDDPADTAASGDLLDMRDEILSAAIFLFYGLCERRLATPSFLALELLEIVFVHTHAIEFERETTTQFGDDVRVAFGIGLFERLDFLHNEIRVLHVSLVEGEVHFDLLLRNPFQHGQIECFC